ncbi:hypothetical protein KA001_01040 [Patescibacteria group bacterium]|nr:hypothetical protein [Patescibacteria group bacterium]
MPVQNLNLIPTEVIREGKLKSTQSKAIFYSVAFLLVCLIFTGVSFYFVTTSKSKVLALKKSNTDKISELKSLENLEKSAQITQNRLELINNIVSAKIYYSKVLTELQNKSNAQITIEAVEIDKDFGLVINGVASTTLTLQNYVNNLVKGPNNLFSQAKILSLDISEGLGNAKFSVKVEADKKLLANPNE